MAPGKQKITPLRVFLGVDSVPNRLRLSSSWSRKLLPRNPVRFKVAVFLVALFVINGCAESSERRAQRLEPMLAQAGFRAVPANTPVRAQRLSEMAALKVSYFSRNGKPSYWFADPYVCHCLYVGSQQSYDQFQQLEQERAQEVTDENEQNTYDQFMTSPAGQVFYGE